MAGSNGAGWKEGVDYNCRVEGVQPLESPNSGNPYLNFNLIVIDGEQVGEKVNFEAYATDGTRARLKRTLNVLGFVVGTSSWDDLAVIVTGKECAVTFKPHTFNNKTTMKADNIKSRSAADQPGGILGRIAGLFGEKVTTAAGPKHPDVPF